jgi:hypothetical protein
VARSRKKTTIPSGRSDRQATTKEGMAVPIGKFVEYEDADADVRAVYDE